MKRLKRVLGLIMAAAGAISLFRFIEVVAAGGSAQWPQLLIGILLIALAVRVYRRSKADRTAGT